MKWRVQFPPLEVEAVAERVAVVADAWICTVCAAGCADPMVYVKFSGVGETVRVCGGNTISRT